jgi:hypothetical protein
LPYIGNGKKAKEEQTIANRKTNIKKESKKKGRREEEERRNGSLMSVQDNNETELEGRGALLVSPHPIMTPQTTHVSFRDSKGGEGGCPQTEN